MDIYSGLKGLRVLVTGDTGFSGVWLCHILQMQGAEVKGYSRDDFDFSTLFRDKDFQDSWERKTGLVEDLNSLSKVIGDFKPELIFHLAAQSLVGRGFSHPMETFSSNVMGTASVLKASLSSSELRGVVIVTTDKVYKESSKALKEDSLLGGKDPYACSKVAAEEVVKGFRPFYEKRQISLSVARGGNIIGGGDWSENRIVPDLVKAKLQNQEISLRYPASTRPWQHVLDLVYSYSVIGSAMIKECSARTNSIYNVGPSEFDVYSVLDLVEEFELHGFQVEKKFVDPALIESATLTINSDLIGEQLGWSPRLKFTDAVRLTADWYQNVTEEKVGGHTMTRKQTDEFLRRLQVKGVSS
jgi:CDP-glucose 4,6-dehydratase